VDPGDTIVQYFSDVTLWAASITVRAGEKNFRTTSKTILENAWQRSRQVATQVMPAGLFGDLPQGHSIPHEKRVGSSEHDQKMLDRMADRLTTHVEDDEMREAEQSEQNIDENERDTHFYHYVLARECRNLQKDLSASPPKQYSWADWEYFLKLMGNEDDPKDYPGQQHPDILVPDALMAVPSRNSDTTIAEKRASDGKRGSQDVSGGRSGSGATMTDGAVDRDTEISQWKQAHEKRRKLVPHPEKRNHRRPTTMDVQDWSWLSNKSPLMGTKSEAEWILERLSAALERELNRQRKGYKRKPPISMSDVRRRSAKMKAEGREGNAAQSKEAESLDKAAKSAA